MERVQLNLERQLSELRDLEKKKIFTKSEISEIVKRRTAFETSLIRKGSNERDWLGYIEYEKRLEQLRKLRCSKLKLKGRPTVSDYSISRHILSLYASSVTRVPGSSRLWQAYITHVLRTSNSSPEISRVLARAISLHPSNEQLWLLAIRFEADGTSGTPDRDADGADSEAEGRGIGGGNMDAARKLCMRALRFMRSESSRHSARAIWKEWVRLEISFVERMRKRWELLGIADVMTGQANLQETELEDAMDASGASEDAEATQEAVAKAVTESLDKAQKKGKSLVLDGAIIKVVIENAITALPQETTIYSELLALIRPLPTPLRASLLQHIYTSLRSSITAFQATNRIQAITLLAQRHFDDLAKPASDGLSLKAIPIDTLEWTEAVGASVKEYQAALRRIPRSRELSEHYGTFVRSRWEETEDPSLKQYLAAHLVRLQQGCRQYDIPSDLLSRYVQQTVETRSA